MTSKSSWSADVYTTKASVRAAAGTPDFAYSASGATVSHSTLDPLNARLDPDGVRFRECRDSAACPVALPVILDIDITGSMLSVPPGLQKRLPQLHGLLLRKGYAPGAQIMYAAHGDATAGDPAPLQVSQFELGNEGDEDLQNLLLVGRGGGGVQESAELVLYFAARHVVTDHWEKRGAKGYLFIISDEMAYPFVSAAQVRDIIGGGLQADLPLDALMAEVLERWEVFYIMPDAASNAGDKRILEFWRNLLGEQNVITLPSLDDAAETIALTIGLCEGTTTLDAADRDLADVGSSATAASKALAKMGAAASGRGGLTLVPAPADLDVPGGNERL